MTVATDGTIAAGAEVVETTVTPEPTTAAPVETPQQQDPEALKTWAKGAVMDELIAGGWSPPNQAKTVEPSFEPTPGHPDIPKHPKWDKWEEEGNTDAQDAYIGAVKVNQASVDKFSSSTDERMKQIEGHMLRNSCLQAVSSAVPAGARVFIDKAVADLEKQAGGQRLSVDNPAIREYLSLKAEKMWRDTGGDKALTGETNGVTSQHNAGLSQSLKDEWLPLFKQTGYPGTGPNGFMTDKELETELRNMGEIK